MKITKALENKLTIQLAYDFYQWALNNRTNPSAVGYMEGHTAGYYLGYENAIHNVYGKEIYSRIGIKARLIARYLLDNNLSNSCLYIDRNDHTKGLDACKISLLNEVKYPTPLEGSLLTVTK